MRRFGSEPPGQGHPSPLTVLSPDLAAGAFPTEAIVDGDREKPTIATIDLQSACVAGKSGKALYAVFALPDGGPYTVSLSSVPLGRSLFAPHASVLDAQGAVLREETCRVLRAGRGYRHVALSAPTCACGTARRRRGGTVGPKCCPTGQDADRLDSQGDALVGG